jgi:hypothetical protein
VYSGCISNAFQYSGYLDILSLVGTSRRSDEKDKQKNPAFSCCPAGITVELAMREVMLASFRREECRHGERMGFICRTAVRDRKEYPDFVRIGWFPSIINRVRR